MLLGKVKEAIKLINADSETTGVHEITDSVRLSLEEKHPSPEDADSTVIKSGEEKKVECVIFEEINQELVQKAAQETYGSGGPPWVNAEIWKTMVCSRRYGKCTDELAEEIAIMGRRICTEKLSHETLLTHLSNRLIPLIKEDNGIRPIGIGEVLRRIIGKYVNFILKADIQEACGTLQTCAGTKSGIEAAIHAMKNTFQEDWCRIIMLVDADNAFNRLNRNVALQNIKKICPSLYGYLDNSYRNPGRLYLSDGTFILSQEGATQGDNLAMQMYGLATRGLIDSLETETKEEDLVQVWYADDSNSAGTIEGVKKWWDHLKEEGPKYGYYPKPSKTYIVVKDLDDLAEVQNVFGSEGIKVTTEGHRHLGAAIGSEQFKASFVSEKVKNWVKDIEDLAIIAEDEPQAALCAFNTAIIHRWTYHFQPIENAIRHRLIPALVGREISDMEREIFALPYRHGGMGIQNPVYTSNREYNASVEITKDLTNLIIAQDMDITKIDEKKMNDKKKKLRAEKELELKKKS